MQHLADQSTTALLEIAHLVTELKVGSKKTLKTPTISTHPLMVNPLPLIHTIDELVASRRLT